MELKKRPEVDRFLRGPPADIRAALIWGRDRGGVRERADLLAKAIAPVPDDPFNVALLTEPDLDRDPARLDEELSALSLMGGRSSLRHKRGTRPLSLARVHRNAALSASLSNVGLSLAPL